MIFMEVQRSTPPAEGFLEGVRALATKHDAVLIFDECTSGFRRTLGGLHLHYGVEPDLATFGKTLGNGYAITAVIGREEVMQAAQSTFISSTFWTERIGPTAALAALDAMAEEDAPARVHEIGTGVLRIAGSRRPRRPGLTLTLGELPALATYTIDGRDPLLVKTFLTSRLLDAGILGGPGALRLRRAHPRAARPLLRGPGPDLRGDRGARRRGPRRAAAPRHRAIGVRPAHVTASSGRRPGRVARVMEARGGHSC